MADARLAQLKDLGETKHNIYGYTEAKGLSVFYLLMDRPSVYGLPENPVVPQRPKNYPPITGPLDVLTAGLATIFKFRERGAKAAASERNEKNA
jgi:formate dehydrogenase iron-sulfur subunit